MAQIELIDSIKKETKIDKGGRATISMRGAARCVGISQQALSKSFQTSDNLAPSELAKKLAINGFDVGCFASDGIPLEALEIIAFYYATGAGRHCTQSAKSLFGIDSKVSEKTHPHDLYIFLDKQSGVCKIGRSSNVLRRLSGIQTGYPFELVVYLTLKGLGDLERTFHELLSDFRLKGEWFDSACLSMIDFDSVKSFLKAG